MWKPVKKKAAPVPVQEAVHVPTDEELNAEEPDNTPAQPESHSEGTRRTRTSRRSGTSGSGASSRAERAERAERRNARSHRSARSRER